MSSPISWAEGSFPSVTGVTSVTDGTADNFSLQLNSNFFSGAAPCSGAQTPANCQGWEQFVYAPGVAFIQYWMIDYVNTCPSGWNTFGSDCWKNSSNSVAVPAQPATNLANITLTGTAGSTDGITMSTGDGTVYTASQASVLNLNQGWTVAEFNIIGNAGGSEAIFNAGSTVVVQTLTSSVTPTTAAPTCESAGFTGETNNLSLVAGSCCPIGGESPGIRFSESNVSGATAGACPGTVKLTPDLLWYNPTSGQLAAWELNNGTVVGSETLSWQCDAASGCSSQWTPVDGMANTLLWDNPTTGQLSEWVFDPSGNVTSPGSLSSTCTSASGCASSWRPIGRMTQGTQSGLLWYQVSTGTLSVWDLSNLTVTGSQSLSWTCDASCAAAWTPMLTEDINNDGNTDVVWYNQTTGQVSVWLLSGATVTGTQTLSSTCTAASGCAAAWKMIGAADVNGDGHTDITWFNASTGQVSSWLLDGSGTVTATQALSWTCNTASGCATTWRPLGFVSFP
ncbi:MAG: VCBS repeat-containing protein [Polyangiaceae bacterium]